MTISSGKFIWYDQMSNDLPGSEKFYSEVVGWSLAANTMNDQAYTLLAVGKTMVGGLMPIPADAAKSGARPTWMGYISVDNVDAYARKLTAAGGTIFRDPTDIPNVGRFAVVGDPHDAGFVLFRPNGEPPPGGPPAPGTPGTIGWHELQAGDLNSAFAFYSGLFGWTKSDAIAMGPMGAYQIFNIDDVQAGGMMTKTPQTPQPFWLYYINVEAIDAAAARATKAGGKICNGPLEVPGGQWIVQCLDPQGAMFAMVAPQR